MPTVAALYRYPVKGLSPEPLDRVTVPTGGTLPFDRAYAIENGPSKFDVSAPRHLPKIAFLMLMRNERLASLATRYDEATSVLTIRHDGAVLAEGDLSTEAGRRDIEEFFDGFEADELRGPAKVLRSPGFSFSDIDRKVVSLINLASIREIEAIAGVPVDHLRFRANVYVEGLAPWREFDWLGKEVRIGAVRLNAIHRIPRCAATEVNPVTAARDLGIPKMLRDTYGHVDCGLFLEVTEGGDISRGDVVEPLA